MLESLLSSHAYGVSAFGPLLHAFVVFAWVVYAFETYLDVRQHRTFSIAHKPKELTYLVQDEFQKSQAYGRDKSSFNFVTSLWGNVKLTAMLYLGFYPFVWSLSGRVLESFELEAVSHPLSHTIVFYAIDTVLMSLIQLPFEAWRIFVVESRHGFNKQSPGLFVSDALKGLVLNLAIVPPLLSLLLTVIEWGGEQFYLYVGGLVLVIQLLAVPFYSNFIQPCFNKVDPLAPGVLRTEIEALAASIDFPLTQLFVIDGSKRSSHSNAYFYGFFKSKRIVLFDTLLQQCSESEVVAVLGHELGHWSLNHTVKNLVLGQLQTVAMFYLFGAVLHLPQLYLDFGFGPEVGQPTYIGLLLFSFIFSPVQHVTAFLMHVLSRRFEFEADAFAVELGHAAPLSRALVTLQKENKGTPISDPLYSAYHHSHPPLLQRLQAIDQKQQELAAKRE